MIRTLVQWTVRTWNFRWGGTVGDTRFSRGVTCAAQSVSRGRTKIIFVPYLYGASYGTIVSDTSASRGPYNGIFFREVAYPCTKGRTGASLAYDSHAGTRPRGVGPAAWCAVRPPAQDQAPTNRCCGRESITVRPTHTTRQSY